MPISRRATLGAVLVAPLLVACGTTEAPVTSSAIETATGGAVTVTDARGVTVTLDAPATRVVTLEWGPTEDVLTLGVDPVGAADPAGFGTWVTSQTLPDDVIDVGLRTEPSLESIAKAEPDLILGIEGSIPEEAIEQAEEIAPVVLLTGSDATQPLENMRQNFLTTAQLLGRTAEAETTLAAMDTAFAEAATALEGQTQPYVFTYINTTGSAVDLRMHSDRSLPGAVAAELGLVNGYTEPGDDVWGIGSLDLEGMTTLPANTRILYWASGGADPVTDLTGNAVWESLDAVKDGEVHPAADGIWVYGGPASLTQWADDLVSILA